MVTLHYAGVGSFASQAILSDSADGAHFARRYRDALSHLATYKPSETGRNEAQCHAAFNLISSVFALPLCAVVDAAKHARSIASTSRLEMVGRRTLSLFHPTPLITGTELVSDLVLYVRAIAYLATQQHGIRSWSQQTIAPKELSLVALLFALSPRIVYRDAIALERLLRTKFEGANGLTNRLAA